MRFEKTKQSGETSTRKRLSLLTIMVALALLSTTALKARSLPLNEPVRAASGTIRIRGNDRMEKLMKYWQEGYRRSHREMQFDTSLIGTGTGMAGIYTAVADLALMGREATPSEIMAFQWVYKYPPLRIDVATGSLDVPGKSFAVVVLVNRDNPISHMTVAQLDGIFSADHLRGPRSLRTWGDLGLTGEWADKPINPYGYDVETGTGQFFKAVVFNGADKWSCALKEFAVPKGASDAEPGKEIMEALARDRYGIAYSTLRYGSGKVKALALSGADGGPYYEPTRENLKERKYPLTRFASVYLNRTPGKPVDPEVKEFLRYVLSEEGQREVARDGDFLPLSNEAIREQLRKLD